MGRNLVELVRSIDNQAGGSYYTAFLQVSCENTCMKMGRSSAKIVRESSINQKSLLLSHLYCILFCSLPDLFVKIIL